MSGQKAKLARIEAGYMRSENLPPFSPGDTVKVHYRVREGEKERIQVFQGVVIKRHDRRSPSATFTVRKVSYGTGVERTFPYHSPLIQKLEVATRGRVRRARLYYLRQRTGKKARIRELAWNAKIRRRADSVDQPKASPAPEPEKVVEESPPEAEAE